ncbi:Negative acting factor [Geosmithia morbida]|uniref:Negative acting factor n=1 Tax=Geosmithia morbida TaxID=1094350 RepID=A0A9P4YW38_9HYPO|nr:Negative acting factor [Geosmithia morbida]KAF4124176.1 Negative acting factor [Geosmithia morbida]
MLVEELINRHGPAPPVPKGIQNDTTYQEVVKVYHEMYAPGLHALFESIWFYFTENGKMSFPRQGSLVAQMAVFLKVLENIKVTDRAQMMYSSTLELRLVWDLAKNALSAAPDGVDNRTRETMPHENDAVEVKARFRLVQALLDGTLLPFNPACPPIRNSNNPHRLRELEFWFSLGEFVTTHVNASPMMVRREADMAVRGVALETMRKFLDGRENRDVIYSIAVVRHNAYRFNMAQAMLEKYHLPESDARNKAVVASKFIMSQTQATGSMTNVTRRICDLANQLYVSPGYNIILPEEQ